MDENEEKIEEKEHSKKSKPVLPLIIFIVLCLVGALTIFSLDTSVLDEINLDFFSDDQSNKNTEKSTEKAVGKIGNHEFKIPVGYEKQESKDEASGGQTVSFVNENNNILYITYLNQQLNLEVFSKEYGKELGNEGVKLTINGEPAYRFEIHETGYSFYSYVMNINGDTYTFLINKETPNPDDFIAKLIP